MRSGTGIGPDRGLDQFRGSPWRDLKALSFLTYYDIQPSFRPSGFNSPENPYFRG